jgi:AraC-like DNA-binding protein
VTPGGNADRWAGRLGIARGFLLYTGPGGSAVSHSHYAIQLAWSDAAPITLELTADTITTHTVLIPSGQLHALHTSADQMTILFVDPRSRAGRTLSRAAATTPISELVERMPSRVVPIGGWPEPAHTWIDRFVTALDPDNEPENAGESSAEVDAAIAFIAATLPDVPRLTDAATAVGVSPDRLRRVFRACAGLPFRQFVLWERLRLAVRAVQRGANLTDSAASAGFSDSAHLSRVFKATFGLSPSSVLPGVTIIGPPTS